MGTTSCEHLNTIWWFFATKNPDFDSRGETVLKLSGGAKIRKIINFEPKISFRVARWSSYSMGMQYPRVLSIGTVWSRSDHSIPPKSPFWGWRWANAHKRTYNHLRAQNRYFEPVDRFGVLRWSPYVVYRWYPGVLSIGTVWDRSGHYISPKSCFLDLKLTYNHRSHHGASLCSEPKSENHRFWARYNHKEAPWWERWL